jgi:hypothetical protein
MIPATAGSGFLSVLNPKTQSCLVITNVSRTDLLCPTMAVFHSIPLCLHSLPVSHELV